VSAPFALRWYARAPRWLRRALPPFAATAVLAGVLAAIPTPYYIIVPGTAVDLHGVITVDGKPPPHDRFYLTDVFLIPGTALSMVEGLLPGNQVIKRAAVVPNGVDREQYDKVLAAGMMSSQQVATVVAERAAGLAVPRTRIYLLDFTAGTRSRGLLRKNDMFVSVLGKPIRATGDIAKIVGRLRPGTDVAIVVRRDGKPRSLNVPTVATKQGTRLGILIADRVENTALPVPVRFNVGDVSGSSGGLMFALDIYEALKPAWRPGASQVAGTGTLAADGTVGPIEGAMQKLIAAKRAGAQIFVVPRENAAELASVREPRVVAVGTFQEAVTALRGK
jgi:PDZ domain-containing protein